MRKSLFIVLLLCLCLTAQADEFYFGAIGNQNSIYNDGQQTRVVLDSLKNMLGFNVYAPWGARPAIIPVMADSLKLIPQMDILRNDSIVQFPAYAAYVKANYGVMEAEDAVHEVRFLINTGQESNGYVYSPVVSSGDTTKFLDSLWYELDPDAAPFTYVIRVKIDTLQISRDQSLGFLRIYGGGWWPDIKNHVIVNTIINSNMFFDQHQEIIEISVSNIPSPEYNYIQISTFQQVQFGIDWFKVYNQQGHNLIVNNAYVPAIAAFAASHSDSWNVLYWYLRDEPRFTHWLPYRVVKDAISSSRPGNSVFNTWMDQSPRDFIDKVQPNLLWADPYPLRGGQTHSIDIYHGSEYIRTDSLKRNNITHYTGTDGPLPISRFWEIGGDRGLQYDLDIMYVRELDSLYSAAKEAGLKMMVTPQAWGEKFYDCTVYYNPGDSSFQHHYNDAWANRPPTRSELSCMTNIAMCYPLQGIIYWRYDAYRNHPQPSAPCGNLDDHNEHSGILEVCSNNVGMCLTPLWHEIHENIGPYVNAIGGLYVGLDHRQAYRIRPDSAIISGTWISSISAASDGLNRDLGWFNVGEFYDDSAKYVMLVNRACSRDSLDPTEAPPVTAVVKFDPATVGTSNVYIIDIAHTTHYDSTAHQWKADPETTYSSGSAEIPFTTILRAGEGRLYKIASITGPNYQLTKR